MSDRQNMPEDVKVALDKVLGAWDEFKKKADEEQKQFVRRGSSDVVTREEAAKINAALDSLTDEVNALHKKANRPIIADVSAAAQLETKANRAFVNGAWRGEQVAATGAEDLTKAAGERAEYKRAFDKLLRRGEKALSPDEQKALSVGSAPDGGFYVEPARADYVVQKVFETSEMRAIASVMTIGGASLKIPLDRDEAGYEWVGETTAPSTTSTPKFGELEIPVHELSAMPKLTQNLLDDAMFDADSWLADKVSSRFGRGENQGFVTGDGVKKPKGFTAYATAATDDATRAFGTLQHVVSGANGAFAGSNPGDCLIDLVYKLKAAYRANATFAMNRATVGTVRKLKDGQGNYLWQPSFQAGQPSTLLNFPVAELEDMASIAANSLSIAFGDFKAGYQIVDRMGIRQLRDPYTAKPYVVFWTTKRVGGGVIDSEAIKLLKFST